MADQKVSELADLGSATANDYLYIVDGGTTSKRITFDNLQNSIQIEGTAVKSTGEATGTKFLREDGDGSCSWQYLAAGGRIYKTVGPTGSGTDYETDGTSDETQINAALTAVAAAGGGVVFLITGTYTITSTKITIPTKCTLEGDGRNATIIKAGDAFADNEIIYMNSANCQVKHLKIDGNATNTAAAYNSITTYTSSEYCIVEDVYLIDVAKNGMSIYGDHHIIKNCRVTTWGKNATGDGILLYNATYSVVESCMADGGNVALANGLAAYSPEDDCHDNIFSNCIAETNAANHGFNFERAWNITLNNCISHHNAGNGFNFTDNTTFKTHDIFMNNCIGSYNTLSGANFDRGNNYYLSNCSFNNNTVDGVRTGGGVGVNYFTMSNCAFDTNGGYGFRTFNSATARYYTISNCQFHNSAVRGIDLGELNDVSVTNTEINTCAGHGIYFNGDRTIINGCNLYACGNASGEHGIIIDSSATAWAINNCIISNSAQHGVYLNAGDGVLSGNVIKNSADIGASAAGIRFANSKTNVTITGNRIYGHVYGINLGTDNNYTTILGNDLSGNDTAALNGTPGTNCFILSSTSAEIDGAVTHAADNTQAHSDYLLNSGADEAVGPLTITADNSTADQAYVPMVLYNTDATPPAASGFPIGTIYVQYTP